MKRNLLLILAAMVCMFMSGCGKDPDNDKEPIFNLYSYDELLSNGEQGTLLGPINIFPIVLAYNAPDDTLFKVPVYVTVEMIAGKTLMFDIDDEDIDVSSVLTTDTSEKNRQYYFDTEMEWKAEWTTVQFDYWRQIKFVIESEGVYEFQLKFCQPGNDRIFYSPKYRMVVETRNMGTEENPLPLFFVNPFEEI